MIVKEVFHFIEFETGTTYLADKLHENQIEIIDSAHGMAVYCSIVNYDIFHVFSKMQESHRLLE